MTKTAHMIGLCGAGMSAVAHLLQEAGYAVTGSDEGFYPPVSDYLTKLGIPCSTPYAAANLPDDPDLVVIGKNAKLVPETNDEVRVALKRYRDRVRSFPEVLAELTAERDRIVVAGSYGKSSLTSIITHCLARAGKEPGFFIGAIPKDLDTSSSLGGDGPFIFEGDEYPSANWDDQAKFLHYAPQTVVLTSATHDHVNIYPTLRDYHAPFLALLEGLEERGGTLIACADEAEASRLYSSYHGPRARYGFDANRDWRAVNVVSGNPTRFDLVGGGVTYPGFTTTQIGRHAVENMVGAAAVLLGGGYLTPEELQDGIASFSGLTRRLDKKTDRSRLTIYEGFGSSYEKARAAIEAMRDHFAGKKLTVLFEPHTFTWRNRAALGQYGTAFEDTAKVWLYSPPTQGAGTHDQVTLDEIAAVAREAHADVRTFQRDEAERIVRDADPDEDVVLILSSGSFDGALTEVIAAADRVWPA
ncbi:UDP-N-acetylmuramate--L-alanine ligase [Parvularcula dongshanensis]|uniref:UDP-N-acetylmuramate: L-alanyl-gamma-D-glutamyl-meso-diaminopimelate ligase n=1 Tax=Parvularcula dongshanensis TaxID=1173995 RepID=A0A840I6Z9_9PROT|nr:Mur ligase family protein [Parvularcula dongshanensis]MBB4659878.1 UDP-N-acetylmuramate: L-alanyl-gamma-D-glutamyl-meso-diaminopimelate ligase [Parvularcula dongshanensis]